MRTEFQCIVHHPRYGVLTKTTVLSEKSFQRIQESSRIRQCQENPGNREDEICSKLPNEFLSLRSSSVMASWQSVRDCMATWIFSTLTYLPPFLPPSDSPKRRNFKRNTIFVNLKAQLASRRNCCSKKSTPSCTSHQHIVLVSTPERILYWAKALQDHHFHRSVKTTTTMWHESTATTMMSKLLNISSLK